MPAPDASVRFRSDTQNLTAATLIAARSTWQRLDPDNLDRSWASVSPRMLLLVAAAQQRAARTAVDYVPAVLEEQDIGAQAAGRTRVDPLVGVASDGRPLDSLLYQPVVRTKELIGEGAAASAAMGSGLASLETIIATQVVDAARAATGIGVATRPRVGYVRQLVTPSCPRCVVLAGRYYRWNKGFDRHPNCFPAGVSVSGPGSRGATRRWYEGELVLLTTASGQFLPLTGNHPVLTSRGWLPANLIHEGDDVIRSTRPQGARPLVGPDHHQMPASIEDVWSALSVSGLHTVESTPKDFHGDGQHGQVDVVGPNGPLHHGLLATLGQHLSQSPLALRSTAPSPLDGQRSAVLLDLWDPAPSGGHVGGHNLLLPLGSGHLCGADLPGSAGAPTLDASLLQSLSDDPTRYPVLNGEPVLAGPGFVGADDVTDRDLLHRTRWDAPGDTFSVETAEGYARLGRDLLGRLASQVELDRVIELRRVQWSGHVYSLSSVEGWHTANNLIVSNCDCTHIPSIEDRAGDYTTDPRLAIEQGQVRGLSRADTKAIVEDGADVAQVINAHRGIKPGGITTVGTTRRAFAARRMRTAGDTFQGARTSRYSRTTGPRLRPEAIYKTAESREEAIGLLRRYGYVV